MIEVVGLSKLYGDVVAVSDVSFEAQPGTVFGLLGPNGAGKSSTIGCLSGLYRPSSGTIRLMGRDLVREPVAARRRLGIVPQELALYEDLSARENLRYWGAIYGLRARQLRRRVGEVLARIGLLDRADDRVSTFSGGMKRRLNFGCGLVHGPEVLLLDEPTVGIDPQSRERLLELVRELADEGACVLYTTHYMEEAESLCDEIAVMDHGKILASGTLESLRDHVGERDVLRLHGSFDPDAVHRLVTDAERWPEIETEVLQAGSDRVILALPRASHHLVEVLGCLSADGAEVRETNLHRPSLESLFLSLTGRELRD